MNHVKMRESRRLKGGHSKSRGQPWRRRSSASEQREHGGIDLVLPNIWPFIISCLTYMASIIIEIIVNSISNNIDPGYSWL